MDLKSLLTTSEDGDRPPDGGAAVAPPPPAPKQPTYHPHQQSQTPTTPAQTSTPYAFRESVYSVALQSSPGKPVSSAPQEYAVHPQAPPPPPHGSYPPPSPYQTPGPYGARPAPPPLQPASYNDVRSPGGASMPGPSPYRHTPTSSVSAASGGYPFPPTGPPHEATSPIQRHQFPPSNAYPPRDSYSQQPGPPIGVPTHPHAGGPYMQQQQQQQQQQHPMPQTPPIGTSGPGHPYPHQRSQSTHSTPTPTSAQSQHQYGPPYAYGSPVATTHPPPGEYNRQQSQPPTPLGPPLSAGPRHSSIAPNYAQPPSPYQQRMSTANLVHQVHTSPPPPPPPAIPRMPSSHSTYDTQMTDIHRRSQSHSERDRSISISPKTRIPSLPSSAGGHQQPYVHVDEPKPPQSNVGSLLNSDRAVTPAKRKLDDRDLSPREMEKRETRPPPGDLNGGHVPPRRAPTRSSISPMMQRKKRVRYTALPVWAQTWNPRENRRLTVVNFELPKRGTGSINGKHESVSKQETVSRHASPETTRSIAVPPVQEPKAEGPLGSWEPSITGVKPYEEISKNVADFLFLNVVNNPDSGEITSRGIQFEIEAKLGTLIDRDTNDRVEKFVTTECLLHDAARVAFRSSMTEAQHKGMNDFLNQMVVQTDPRNPNAAKTRVQVHYRHRREVDKFFELPISMHARLPGSVRALFPPKHTIKVRVTYDQKTRQVLQTIVKARVADINLHMPNCPLDCRISVNLEMAWDGPVEEIERLAIGHADKFPDRNKDRLSYNHSHYQIDLTQVSQMVPGPGNSQRLDKEHELEIELSSDILIDQGRRALAGEPHQYQELVEGFVDNIRVMARRTRDFV